MNIRLYGTLSCKIDQYDHADGLEVTMNKDASVHDLLLHLKLDTKGIGMIFMDGRPVIKETCLKNGAQIRIFQPIFGG